MNRAPFPVGLADDVFTSTTELELRLHLVRALIGQSTPRMPVIEAPGGAGKSAFLDEAGRRLEAEWRVCRVSAETRTDADARPALMLLTVGIRADPRPTASLRALRSIARRLAAGQPGLRAPRGGSRRGLVLVLDDAHRLDDTTLRFVASLGIGADLPGLRVVLAGDSGFADRIRRLPVAEQDLIRVLDLPPLDQAAIERYIRRRLALDRTVDRSRFSQRAIRRIARRSRGNPGAIDELARALLEDSSDKGTTGSVRRAIEASWRPRIATRTALAGGLMAFRR